MTAFDWPLLMRAGINGLGLLPREFWALTPSELEIMLGRRGGIAPLNRDRLSALADAFPDVKREMRDG